MRAGSVGIALVAMGALALAGGCSAGSHGPTVADSSPHVTPPAAATHGAATENFGVKRHCGLLDRSGTAGTSRFVARAEVTVPDGVSSQVRVKASWAQVGSTPIVRKGRFSVDDDAPVGVTFRIRASQAEVAAYPDGSSGQRACHVVIGVSST